VSGDVIVVSAHHADAPEFQSGAAYIFRYNPDTTKWEHEATLTASDGDMGDIFGWSVAIDGDVVLIGARDDENDGLDQSGSAYVFRYDPDTSRWIEEAKLTDPNAEEDDLFGVSVSIRDNVALIGAHVNDDAGGATGAAFVFRYDANGARDWVLEQQLQAFDAKWIAWFGFSVSLADGVALIGAPQDDGQTGAAYVMRYDGQTWVHEAKLLASNPVGPFPMLGRSTSLSRDGMSALGGAPFDDEAGNEAGAVHLFGINGKSWREIEKFTASDTGAGDSFGGSVSLSDDTAVIKGGGKGYIFAGMQGIDCNKNGEPDACDIFDGTSDDENDNGIPDDCESTPGDINGDGVVNSLDLLILLVNWGRCENCDDCPADLDGNCTVGASDLLILLVNWG
ncbi:MAG: dockerin type I domain-containing protein, partial [Phycisphaerales bacterium]